MLFRIAIILVILFLLDLYVFQGVKHLTRTLNPASSRFWNYLFWFVTISCFAIIISSQLWEWRQWPQWLRSYLFAFVFITYLSKVFMVAFLLIDDVLRAFRWTYQKLTGATQKNIIGDSVPSQVGISRSDFLVRVGAIIAAIPFATLIMGMMKGKYEYQVRKFSYRSPRIPDSFRGFKAVQISDLHLGSFSDSEPLERAVEMINDLNPDVIFFTGDLVNDRSLEIVPHINTLKKLSAKFGIYSILGNHDYGDYYRWNSDSDKLNNLQHLKDLQRSLGWKLLLDENEKLILNSQHITVAGIQNWSSRANFARYGDFDKATSEIDNDSFTILLSHDPSQWRSQVVDHDTFIDLTLSGHTHGFQFGVDIPGFKWSPVQYVYKEWAGAYSTKSKTLYVNRGLGFLGYPGRVGILPEITLFEFNNSETLSIQAVS